MKERGVSLRALKIKHFQAGASWWKFSDGLSPLLSSRKAPDLIQLDSSFELARRQQTRVYERSVSFEIFSITIKRNFPVITFASWRETADVPDASRR